MAEGLIPIHFTSLAISAPKSKFTPKEVYTSWCEHFICILHISYTHPQNTHLHTRTLAIHKFIHRHSHSVEHTNIPILKSINNNLFVVSKVDFGIKTISRYHSCILLTFSILILIIWLGSFILMIEYICTNCL